MKKTIFTMSLAALATPLISFAAITTGEGVIQAIYDIADWMFAFFLAIAVIMIIIAAFSFLTGGGDPEKYGKAKTMLLYSAVAIAVAVLARGFSTIVTSIVK